MPSMKTPWHDDAWRTQNAIEDFREQRKGKTMTATQTYKLTIDRETLIDRLLECERQLDETQHYCCVRVYMDGEIKVVESISREVGQDEYYGRMPHPVTVFGRQGAGQCAIDWDDDTDAVDAVRTALEPIADECIEKLEQAGYEVQ